MPSPKQPGLFRDRKFDALLVTKPENVRYLTGFTGSNGWLLAFPDGHITLFTDPRYTVQSKQQADCRIIIAKGQLSEAIISELKRLKTRRLGFEADHLTVARHKAFADFKLKSSTGLIETLRMVKSKDEIAKIRTSVITNSNALEAALKRFKAGMTESELAAEIDYRSRKLGADGPAFDTIVAAGPNAALPHARPGKTKIGAGMLLIDMGAFQAGYASDMTRMVHVGAPDIRYKRAYAAVLESQLAAIDAIKPGVTAGSIDLVTRKVLKRHNLDREFIHSTGHGLGLEIHESPRLGRKDKTKLEPGMVITVEPGIYRERWGGIRIEDTVLVTETGCEILTPTSKELRQIG